MPRLDGTGPEGEGPKTGRGMGDCNSDEDTKDETTKDEELNKEE